MAKLTPDQQKVATAWLHDIFVAGGIGTNKRPDATMYYISKFNSYDQKRIQQVAKVICDAIILRQVNKENFSKIDGALDTLHHLPFFPDVHATVQDYIKPVKKQVAQLAQYMANFCAQKELYWDDSALTDSEKNILTTSTAIGKALFDFECFTSQELKAPKTKTKTNAAQTANTNATNTGTVNTTANTAGAQVSYKATGPHSQDILNLIGTPNKKIMLSGNVYSIIADKTGVNTPNLFITPISKECKPASKSKAEQVKMGSANGHTDCTLWFTSSAVADSVLNMLKNIPDIVSKYQNIRVSARNADPNGYFEVSTSIGNAYIRAQKLNEEFDDEIDTIEDRAKQYPINDIDTFSEAFYRYE